MMDTDGIRKLLDDNDLSLTVVRTEANPFMPGDTADLVHNYCTLSGNGIDSFEFYASTSPEIEPDLADLIEVLLRDVKAYRGCHGYADFLLIFGLDDGEDRADVTVAWTELERLAPLVEQVIDLANNNRRHAAPNVAPGV